MRSRDKSCARVAADAHSQERLDVSAVERPLRDEVRRRPQEHGGEEQADADGVVCLAKLPEAAHRSRRDTRRRIMSRVHNRAHGAAQKTRERVAVVRAGSEPRQSQSVPSHAAEHGRPQSRRDRRPGLAPFPSTSGSSSLPSEMFPYSLHMETIFADHAHGGRVHDDHVAV
jgi:hypothetical protein